MFEADYEVGQAKLPVLLVRYSSNRDVLDAGRRRSRVHPHDDHDDRILNRECLAGYHACHCGYLSGHRAILLVELPGVCLV